MKRYKKAVSVLASVGLAAALMVPVASFAESPSGESAPSLMTSPLALTGTTDTTEASDASEVPIETPATDCVATIKYYENVTHEEPGIPPGEGNRYLLGTRVLTGLTEGEVLDAWDYVVDLPGFFFFDGWPAKITVSTNPDDNIFELFYFRVWSHSYAVNYYLMENADLNADSWSGALSSEDVEFTKFGSEVFSNRPYGELVQGDKYEYNLEGAYVVDSYPSEIRVGLGPEDEAINVLYVRESDVPTNNGSGGWNKPDVPSETPGTSNPGNSSGSSSDTSSQPSAPITLPENSDAGSAGALPSDMTKQEAADLFENYINEEQNNGEIEITDEMLDNPVEPERAREMRAAYDAGYQQAQTNQGERQASIWDHVLCIVIIVILLILCIVFFCLYRREHALRCKYESETGNNESVTKEPSDA